MSSRRLLLIVFLLPAMAFLASCAKQGYPSGGPKDVDPPAVKGVTPPSGSTAYSANRFRLDFNEYIDLKDADNNILVSPPMNPKPEYTVKGKSLMVKFRDTLRPSTTYLFQFSGAVVDYTEGNPLPSFEYVFSTGEAVDSLCLRGAVVDALTLKPYSSPLTILAYSPSPSDTLGDSLIAKVHPTYVTRTAADGSFSLNYLADNSYKIVAIDDGDHNLRHSPSEAIAWLDTAVKAYPLPRPKQDTAKTADTTAVADSTVVADTLAAAVEVPAVEPLRLLVSSSASSAVPQRIVSKTFSERGIARVVTAAPLSNPQVVADSVMWQLNAKGDTLTLYTLRQTTDSLQVILLDSATSLSDTLTLRYRESRHSRRNNSDTPELNRLTSRVSSTHPYFDSLTFAFAAPVSASSLSDITILHLADSTSDTVYADILWPGTLARIVTNKPLQQGEKYRITIPAGATRDIWRRANDSLVFTTTLTSEKDYGTISVSVNSSLQRPVLQLLNDKGEVVVEQVLAASSDKVTFPHLKPATYGLRLFDDRDGDGRWTPGDYYLHRHPEPVFYFGKALQLRENWEMEEDWKVEE